MNIPFLKTKKKILLIEDSETLSKALLIKLRSSGFKPILAKSANEAIEILKKESGIKIIWLDHWLRDQSDGLTVMEYIADQPELKNIPVFIVSACGDEIGQKYIDLGATKFYVKSDHLMASLVDEMVTFLK